ncbi:unnamed protein product, partial [Symbiodinium sp. KB8]
PGMISPGKLALQSADPTAFDNKSGLNTQILLDLLRVIACVSVRHFQQAGKAVPNQFKLIYQAVVTCESCSSKIIILMRAPGAFKQLWPHLVSESKKALAADVILQDASAKLAALAKLLTDLSSETPVDQASILASAATCGTDLKVLCKDLDNLTDADCDVKEAQSTRKELKDSLKLLSEYVDNVAAKSAETGITALGSLWAVQESAGGEGEEGVMHPPSLRLLADPKLLGDTEDAGWFERLELLSGPSMTVGSMRGAMGSVLYGSLLGILGRHPQAKGVGMIRDVISLSSAFFLKTMDAQMDVQQLLSAASELCAQYKANVGVQAVAADSRMWQACKDVLDRLTGIVDREGLDWIKAMSRTMDADAIQTICAKIMPEPSPAVSDSLTTLAMMKDLGDLAQQSAEAGETLAELAKADVMSVYASISSMNESFMLPNQLVLCKEFCETMEKKFCGAIGALDADVKQLSKLADKYE